MSWALLALLYVLWLRVKEVSKLPRCWSRTPALLRRAGMVWDFLSAAVCLDSQASCTLQGSKNGPWAAAAATPLWDYTRHQHGELFPPTLQSGLSGVIPAGLTRLCWSRLLQKVLGLKQEQRCCSGSRDAAGTLVSPAAGWGGHCQPALAWAWGSHAGAGGEGRGRVLRWGAPAQGTALSRAPDPLGFAQRGSARTLPTSAGAGSTGTTPTPQHQMEGCSTWRYFSSPRIWSEISTP